MKIVHTRLIRYSGQLAVLAPDPVITYISMEASDVPGKSILKADDARGHTGRFLIFFQEPTREEELTIVECLEDDHDSVLYMTRPCEDDVMTKHEVLNLQ